VTPLNKRRQYRELPDAELGPELDDRIQAMTRVADLDVEQFEANAHLQRVVVRLRRLLDLVASSAGLSLIRGVSRDPATSTLNRPVVLPPASEPKHGVELRVTAVPASVRGIDEPRLSVEAELSTLGDRPIRLGRGQWSLRAYLHDGMEQGSIDARGIWRSERSLPAEDLQHLILEYRLETSR
jgi:hypothetical protein